MLLNIDAARGTCYYKYFLSVCRDSMEEDDYDEEVKSKKVRVSEIASSQLHEPCIMSYKTNF